MLSIINHDDVCFVDFITIPPMFKSANFSPAVVCLCAKISTMFVMIDGV